MPEQKPSICRMVNYMAYGSPGGEYPSKERAAVITEVLDEATGKVRLCIFNPTGLHWNDSVYSEDRKPGTWAWPPRN
jgi:hypothetical protein